MDTQKVPRKPRKPVIVCQYKDLLDRHSELIERHSILLERLSTVTMGNGSPENGLLFMFRAFLEREERRREDIAEIKKELKDSFEASSKAVKALEIYQAEMGGIEEATKTAESKKTIAENLILTKKRDNRFIVFQVIALCLTLVGLGITIFKISNV